MRGGLVIIAGLCSSLQLSAQCSDAGICALQRVNAGAGHQVSLTYVTGQSGKEDDLRFQTMRLDAHFRVWGEASLSLSLPFSKVSGPLGNASGLSDATVVLDQPFWKGATVQVAAQVGVRLGTGESDAAPLLDQRYQPGLGTTDLLLGFRASHGKNVEGGVGFQKAGSRNDNPLSRLRRADDLLVWAEYRRSFGTLNAGLKALAIKPLSRASVADSVQPGAFRDVPNSDQAQLNLLPFAELPLSNAFALRASAALPLLKRDTNVDGLKRSLTASLGVSYSF